MDYLGLIIGYLIIFLTPVVGMWHKTFPKLGLKASAAFIPFYNYFVLLKACKLPWYWVIFLLFPGAQFIMWASLNVTYVRKFGEFDWKKTILAILFPFPVFWQIAKNEEKYKPVDPTNWDIAKQVTLRTPSDHVALFFALPIIGHIIAYPLSLAGFKRKKGKKSVIKEWGDAILFAVVAASVIRTYIFEPYKIPTGSMEKTLLVGDHLFVDKLTFGPRVPMTPFSYPIVHNSFAPLMNVKSYTSLQMIPYTRIPGFRWVERNDVTVFNFPAGDTALNDPRMPHGLIGHNYHEILRDEALHICWYEDRKGLDFFEKNIDYYLNKARDRFQNEGRVYSRKVDEEDYARGYTEIGGVLTRPVDKTENYIKRCVAVAGDVIEIKNKELYINGELNWQAPEMQYSYSYLQELHPMEISRRQALLDPNHDPNDWGWTYDQQDFFKEKFDVGLGELGMDDSGYITIPLSKHKFELLKEEFNLSQYNKSKGHYGNALKNGTSDRYYPIFPNDRLYDWTEDNFGPLRIPKAGDVVEINAQTIPIYRRIITAYEGHTLEEKSDGIYIDGVKSESYTIEMDYFWMMGDNRNSSADSRYWGFVPEDHIVGHAAFIWLSSDERGMFGGGMRWGRIFNGIE